MSRVPAQHAGDLEDLSAACSQFVEIVGKENVMTSEDEILAHAGSEWSSYDVQQHEKSYAILYPSSTEQVSQVMKICNASKIPVTAYAGGTSLEGHLAPTKGGICIDFSRMDQIISIHKEDLDVTVQPGVDWEALNEELAEHCLFFPPDPGPGAKIGGMVGTGCSGTNAYRYGTMREWVISLTVVLADGTIIKTRQRPRKSSAGYDLTRLFIGSEGTLGLVTEATLRVTSKPTKLSVAVATFPSLYKAAECVAKVVRSDLQLAGIELLDDEQMRFINSSGVTGRHWRESSTLFFKFTGSDTSIQEQIAQTKALATSSASDSFTFAQDEDEAIHLWSARKEALWSVLAAKTRPSDRVWTTDVSVPISRLCEIIQETRDDMTKSGLKGGIVGHAGDGNFHAMILFSENEKPVVEQVVSRMVQRAIEMEGTITGEHGIGLVKRDYLSQELGQSAVDAMRL
ncbi:hypothetical protein VF21_04371 [Pseudogymnoascus sp. 05NY08]|nr:hypothetical protein VF21_04371 [Pseudogymnoascus sp. 05NY08]